ncbi:MAG: FHA domain-containing protein [Thermoanaerobaculia bacterium]|jgi:DNA-binding winged helix-turn-helix (wHTH) protein
MRYQFGGFTLDLAQQELRRGDSPVHLTPKAMQLLEYLIEQRPNVVSHQMLFDRLWPDVVVQEANLKNLVADLRHALDDHERHGRFLRTVHGRGYAFTNEIVESKSVGKSGSARLVIFFHDRRRIILSAGENILGRDEEADAMLDDPQVSRHHARVVIDPDRVTIEDLGSKNGTFVRDVRIEHPVELKDGDEVRLGSVLLVVKIMRRDEDTATAEGE